MAHPRRRIRKPAGIEADVAHARSILMKVRSPWDRYRLTMFLEVAAAQFIDGPVARSGEAAQRKKESRH